MACTVDPDLFGFTHADLTKALKVRIPPHHSSPVALVCAASLLPLCQVQNKKQGQFPGPLPVLAYDYMIDPIQLAQAAEAGAQGVFLNVAALGERTK